MKISTVVRREKTIARILFLPLVLFLVDLHAYASIQYSDEGRIENARWRLEGEVVIITYDLTADPAFAYDVKIILRKQGDQNFQFVPRSVLGAIGKGKFAGVQREIRWDYKKDVPRGLYGDDYFFEFVINPIPEGGGSNFLYYLGGGLAVAGGVAAYLLLNKKVEGQTSGQGSGLPGPPTGRPPQQ